MLLQQEENASTANINVVEDDQSRDSNNSEDVGSESQDPILVIIPSGERYNLIKQLETFEPETVILYHSDMVSLRLLEVKLFLWRKQL